MLPAGGLRHSGSHSPNLQADYNLLAMSQFQLNDFQFIGGVTQLHAERNSCLATVPAPQTPVKMKHANVGFKAENLIDHLPFFFSL